MVDAIIAGALAGFLATVILTFFQLPLSGLKAGSPAVVASKATRLPADGRLNQILGWILHFLYGTAWGAAFAAGLDAWRSIEAFSLAALFGWGLALGLAVWALSQAVVTPMVGATVATARQSANERIRSGAVFAILHLVWGAAVGIFLAMLAPQSILPRLGAAVPAAALVALALVLVAGFVWQSRQLEDTGPHVVRVGRERSVAL